MRGHVTRGSDLDATYLPPTPSPNSRPTNSSSWKAVGWGPADLLVLQKCGVLRAREKQGKEIHKGVWGAPSTSTKKRFKGP